MFCLEVYNSVRILFLHPLYMNEQDWNKSSVRPIFRIQALKLLQRCSRFQRHYSILLNRSQCMDRFCTDLEERKNSPDLSLSLSHIGRLIPTLSISHAQHYDPKPNSIVYSGDNRYRRRARRRRMCCTCHRTAHYRLPRTCAMGAHVIRIADFPTAGRG